MYVTEIHNTVVPFRKLMADVRVNLMIQLTLKERESNRDVPHAAAVEGLWSIGHMIT